MVTPQFWRKWSRNQITWPLYLLCDHGFRETLTRNVLHGRSSANLRVNVIIAKSCILDTFNTNHIVATTCHSLIFVSGHFSLIWLWGINLEYLKESELQYCINVHVWSLQGSFILWNINYLDLILKSQHHKSQQSFMVHGPLVKINELMSMLTLKAH